MKTLLTLFVLLFSSSVVAGDDLSGKSIVCGIKLLDLCKMFKTEDKCLDVPNVEFIMPIEFKNKDQASYYDYMGFFFNQLEEDNEVPLFYHTDLQSIMVYSDKRDKDDMPHLLRIDRKSLNFIFYGGEYPIGNSCIVYDNYEDIHNNILKMKNKIIAEITKDNKL